MERLCSLLLGAAVVLGFLGMAAGVVALLTPPPQDDLGGRVVLDAGTNVPSSPAAVPSVTSSSPSSGAPGDDDSPSNDDSPGDDDSREGTGSPGDDSPTSVPVNPPVVVDDDPDDDPDDDRDDD